MVTTYKKGRTDSLDVVWRAYQRTRTKDVENLPETSLGMHVAPHGSNWQPENQYSKNGAGVGHHISTGHEYDDQTGLYYMQARYQSPTVGRFVSQDPAFWTLSPVLLANPQKPNSYSYADNNPVIKKDASGAYAYIVAAAGIGAGYAVIAKWHGDIIENIADGKTGFAALAPHCSWQDYTTAAGTGAVAAGVAAAEAPFLVAGGLAAGTSMILQGALKGDVHYQEAAIQGTFAAGEIKIFSEFDRVVGRLPGWRKALVTGKHTQRLMIEGYTGLGLEGVYNTLLIGSGRGAGSITNILNSLLGNISSGAGGSSSQRSAAIAASRGGSSSGSTGSSAQQAAAKAAARR